MRRRQLAGVVAAVASAFALVAAAALLDVTAADEGRTGPRAGALLPDLDQETPSNISVRTATVDGEVVHTLGFASAVRNIGDGPLVVEAHRLQAGDTSTMSADQLVRNADGGTDRVLEVGELTFVTSRDHNHWHYLGFDRYELRPAGSATAAVRDRKSGFCLGDRYPVTSRVVTGAVRVPAYTGECGPGRPDLTTITEGISVGWGDDYAAYLEYQELPIDDLPAGRYVLVHHVNEDRQLQEVTYANNVSSVLLDLRWDGDRPRVGVVATCPDTDRCDRTVTVETVATGLAVPWDLAFLPDGRALVTERAGRVRLLKRDGTLRRRPVATVPVTQRGEGGLLGVAPDPEFRTNRLVYLYLSGRRSMLLERWRLAGGRLERDAVLVDAIETGDVHDSGRIRFGPDGDLYVATGDAGDPELSQEPDSLNGKMLRLTPEQYRGAGPVLPTVMATGLRNPQGLDWQPGTGQLYATDHGPTGFDGPEGYDEVNAITEGADYGWPTAMSDDDGDGRFAVPVRIWREAIAPSGVAFVSRPGSPWQGRLVVAGLRGQQLRLLELEDGRVVGDQPLLTGRYGRLRSVTEAPDGTLYVLTSNRDGRGTPVRTDDRILRVRLPDA